MTFTKGIRPWNKGQKFPKFSGENHYNWHGDNVGYSGIHVWLRKNFGKANKCDNFNCFKKSKIFHWAKIKDRPYKRERKNFWMLCQKCHSIYDNFKPSVKFPKGNIPWNKGKKLHYQVWNKKSVIKFCQFCSKRFEIPPSVAKKGKGKYCSKHCFDEFQRER